VPGLVNGSAVHIGIGHEMRKIPPLSPREAVLATARILLDLGLLKVAG
jgi:hypothetical protein